MFFEECSFDNYVAACCVVVVESGRQFPRLCGVFSLDRMNIHPLRREGCLLVLVVLCHVAPRKFGSVQIGGPISATGRLVSGCPHCQISQAREGYLMLVGLD